MFHFKRTSSAFLAALAFATASAQAGPIDYHISVKTGSDGVNREVLLTLTGDKGTHGPVYLDGSFDAHDVDETRLSQIDDIGVVTEVRLQTVAHGLDFGDDWLIGNVTVTRGSSVKGAPTDEGVSTFVINKRIGAGRAISVKATTINRPPVPAAPLPGARTTKEEVDVVKFYNNEKGSANDGAQTTQTWDFGATVGFSTSVSKSMEQSLTLSYQSPETLAGSIGAEASAAFGTERTSAEEHVTSQNYTEMLTLNFAHPDHASVLKLFKLTIPWQLQDYRHGPTTLRMKRLVGKMQLAPDSGESIEIPNRDRDGNVVPISWSEIQGLLDIMARTDPAHAASIAKQNKARWIQNGWVYEGNAPTVTLESGVYQDNLGDYMEVTVSGSTVSVENVTDRTMQNWQAATGTIVGSTIHDLRFVNGGKVAFTAGADIAADGRRVVFDNGYWAYFGDGVAAIPAPSPSPSPTPTTPSLGPVVKSPERAQPETATAVPAPARADLTATFKKLVHDGDRAKIQLLVTNRGDAAAPASVAQVFLSRNKKADPRRDAGLGKERVPELAPGASALVTFQRRIDAERAHGMRVIAHLDVNGAVAESDEANEFRGGMKLQVDRKGSSERASKLRDRAQRKAEKADGNKKGGKKTKKTKKTKKNRRD